MKNIVISKNWWNSLSNSTRQEYIEKYDYLGKGVQITDEIIAEIWVQRALLGLRFPKLNKVRLLLGRISCEVLGKQFRLKAYHDKIFKGVNPLEEEPRIFIQVEYEAPCSKTGFNDTWKGGKHYLSDYMTDDEIVKKAWVAFEQAVKHEVMEGFKVDNLTLFNPHVNFEELLKISEREVVRLKN